MEELPARCQKTEDDAFRYFKNFLSDKKNKKLIFMLKGVLSELSLGLMHSSLFFLRVKAANANSQTSFNKAWIDAEVHQKESFPLVAPLCLFFLRGYATLDDFLDSSDPKIPENLAERQALRDLLLFLSNEKDQSCLLEHKSKCRTEFEVSLATRLAQHLLVPLVPHKTVMIDSCPSLQFARCCQVEPSVSVGDTSYGCPNGWHGRADVLLLGDQVPLTVFENSVEDAVSLASDSSVRTEKSENFTLENISQITAETIVSSFVKQRQNPTTQCSLMPGIGFCSGKMIVYLYDCVEDILLTTGPLDLYAQMGLFGLNARAVLILWLILNHSLFSNKTPERYKSYKASFHHVLGPVQLDAYRNESEQPFTERSDAVDVMQIFNKESASFEDDLAQERNIQFPNRQSVSLNRLE